MVDFAEQLRAPDTDPPAVVDDQPAPVARSATPIQAKLVVGAAGDRYEREADAIADQVGRLLSRASSDETSGRVRAATTGATSARTDDSMPAGRVQRMTGSSDAAGVVDDDTDRQVRDAVGRGRPLPAEVRREMEPAFGADFGHVRVHDDSGATELNQRIQAKAFTTGSDIFFRDGVPDTASEPGRQLLAHELTHTIQQDGAARPTVQRYLDPTQVAELESARQRLKAVLQTPKGKGKPAAARKKRITDLRSTIEDFEAKDASTPEPVVAPTATDPEKQEELDRKVARLAELEGEDPSTLDEKQARQRDKNIARLNRGIAALTAPAAQEAVAESSPVPDAKSTDSKPESTASPSGEAATQPDAKVDAKVDATPEPAGPDLAVESLRTSAAQLAELKGKDLPPAGNARRRHNKKIRELEAAVAALETAIQAAHPELSKLVGNSHAQELGNAFGEGGVSALRQVIPDTSLKTVCDKVGAEAMKGFVDLYGAATFWARLQAWGVQAVERLVAKFTPTKVRDLDLAIGPSRFRYLLVARSLSAEAFAHYSTNFLKTFAGATDTTWQHLVTVKYSAYSGGISGGHDEAVFNKFVDDENEGRTEPRISIDRTRSVGSNKKVFYTVYDDQGDVVHEGSKTLIPGLSTQKAAMLSNVNTALWRAISRCEFDTATNEWSASTPDGKHFTGFLRNGLIDTFYPA